MKKEFFKMMQALVDKSIKLSEKGRKAMVHKSHLAAWEYFAMADATWKAYEAMLETYDRLETKTA